MGDAEGSIGAAPGGSAAATAASGVAHGVARDAASDTSAAQSGTVASTSIFGVDVVWRKHDNPTGRRFRPHGKGGDGSGPRRLSRRGRSPSVTGAGGESAEIAVNGESTSREKVIGGGDGGEEGDSGPVVATVEAATTIAASSSALADEQSTESDEDADRSDDAGNDDGEQKANVVDGGVPEVVASASPSSDPRVAKSADGTRVITLGAPDLVVLLANFLETTGVSQREIARTLSCAPSSISRFASGNGGRWRRCYKLVEYLSQQTTDGTRFVMAENWKQHYQKRANSVPHAVRKRRPRRRPDSDEFTDDSASDFEAALQTLAEEGGISALHPRSSSGRQRRAPGAVALVSLKEASLPRIARKSSRVGAAYQVDDEAMPPVPNALVLSGRIRKTDCKPQDTAVWDPELLSEEAVDDYLAEVCHVDEETALGALSEVQGDIEDAIELVIRRHDPNQPRPRGLRDVSVSDERRCACVTKEHRHRKRKSGAIGAAAAESSALSAAAPGRGAGAGAGAADSTGGKVGTGERGGVLKAKVEGMAPPPPVRHLHLWSPADAANFELALGRYGKHFGLVASVVPGRTSRECVEYYYGVWKKLPRHPQWKRGMGRELEFHDDSCAVCDSGGDLLCCDSCRQAYHFSCLNPPLFGVPEDDWACPRCRRFPLSEVEAARIYVKAECDRLDTMAAKRKAILEAPAADGSEDGEDGSEDGLLDNTEERTPQPTKGRRGSFAVSDAEAAGAGGADFAEVVPFSWALPYFHNLTCAACDREGSMRECDTCSRVYHLACLEPPPDSAREGAWCCPVCTSAAMDDGMIASARKRVKHARRRAAALRQRVRLALEKEYVAGKVYEAPPDPPSVVAASDRRRDGNRGPPRLNPRSRARKRAPAPSNRYGSTNRLESAQSGGGSARGGESGKRGGRQSSGRRRRLGAAGGRPKPPKRSRAVETEDVGNAQDDIHRRSASQAQQWAHAHASAFAQAQAWAHFQAAAHAHAFAGMAHAQPYPAFALAGWDGSHVLNGGAQHWRAATPAVVGAPRGVGAVGATSSSPPAMHAIPMWTSHATSTSVVGPHGSASVAARAPLSRTLLHGSPRLSHSVLPAAALLRPHSSS